MVDINCIGCGNCDLQKDMCIVFELWTEHAIELCAKNGYRDCCDRKNADKTSD